MAVSRVIKLADGILMPSLGLGTFQGSYDIDYSNVINVVKRAIDVGYRHIDSAPLCNTEVPIGIAIKEKIQEGVVKRDDLFITTKLWCTNHRRHDVVPALKRSLESFGLNYVDNFLIHFPIALKPSEEHFPVDENGKIIYDACDLTETWKGMEECKQLGLARTIGISSFSKEQIESLLPNCSTKPSNIQLEVNPFFSNAPLVNFCQENNITVCCFSPLGKPGRSWETGPDYPHINTDPVLLEIAEKHKKTTAQITLRWLLQRSCTVIVKSNSPERQQQNLDVFDFKLSESEMSSISSCNKNFRVMRIAQLADAPTYPFSNIV